VYRIFLFFPPSPLSFSLPLSLFVFSGFLLFSAFISVLSSLLHYFTFLEFTFLSFSLMNRFPPLPTSLHQSNPTPLSLHLSQTPLYTYPLTSHRTRSSIFYPLLHLIHLHLPTGLKETILYSSYYITSYHITSCYPISCNTSNPIN
jgi:hypothetical protein